MATDSPLRMVESSQPSKWISSKDAAAFESSFKSKVTEDLGFFFKGQKFNLEQADLIPSRSGSAPPSMECSVGNIIPMKEYSLNSNPTSLGNFKYEEKWLIDPSCDFNLNPRLLQQSHVDVSTASCKENQSLSTHEEMMVSSEQASGNLVQDTNILKPGQNALMASRHKSLVDLIQEDFPRTPSPVYNQSHLLSHATVEDSVDLDVQAMSLGVSSMNISNPSDSISSPTSVVETESSSTSNLLLNEFSPETFPSLQHADGNKSVQENQTRNKGAGMKDDVSINEVVHTEEHKITLNAEVRKHKPEGQQYNIRYNPRQSFTHAFPFQVPAADMQVISQGINNSQNYLGEVPHGHGHAHFSSFGVQTSFPSPGFGSPLYATPAPFMSAGNQCYPNLQSSGLFTPQYNLGGYAMNSTLYPPYMTGYCSQAGLPLPFGATSGLNVNGQAAGVPSRDGICSTIDFQNQNKFFGQHGLALQHSYLDPLHMHHYPQPFENSYSSALQLNQSGPGDTMEHQGLDLDGKKFHSPINGGLTLPSLSSMGIAHSSYFGNSSGMGVMVQFPALSAGSPVLPSSPIGRTHLQSVPNDIKMPQVSGRNTEFCSGQTGIGSFDDPRKLSIIEDLKSINSQKFELADMAGRILEFSIDQHGSRFIQQKLESCSSEEKMSVFEEVIPHASKLITDVFGNYVIQKFFEHGSPDLRRKLADQLSGQILPVSLQMYGCRVIQKALEFIELDQKIQLVQELDGHVMKCIRDQNGNHVIQKCIECIPMGKIHFIISSFRGQVPTLSTHPYGCRVIQRVLEHCSDEQQIQCIVDEILESACSLAQDQYGNYVTQHVLERGKPHERSQIISRLTGKIVQMSQHKYASNVIEKCLEHGSASERELLIEEIMGHSRQGDNLLAMMKDQFANYVVQKILETSNDGHREILLNHIRVHLHALKKYTYGKHIVARFEQLAGPEGEAEVH